jgi:hypothetical protein
MGKTIFKPLRVPGLVIRESPVFSYPGAVFMDTRWPERDTKKD